MHAKREGRENKRRETLCNQMKPRPRVSHFQVLALFLFSLGLSALSFPVFLQHYNGPRDCHATRVGLPHSRFPRVPRAPHARKATPATATCTISLTSRAFTPGLILGNLGAKQGKLLRSVEGASEEKTVHAAARVRRKRNDEREILSVYATCCHVNRKLS